MLGAHRSGGETPSSYRRRVCTREQIPSRPDLLNIDLGQTTAGRVLNISEGGFAVQTIPNSIDDYIPQIRFKFSRSEFWVETAGQVVWINESRNVAGVEFINLCHEGRNQIRKWLGESRSPHRDVLAEEALQPFYSTKSADPLVAPVHELTADGEFHPTELRARAESVSVLAREDVGWGRDEVPSNRRTRVLICLIVAMSITGLTLFVLRHSFHKARIDQQETQDKTVAEVIQVPIGEQDNTEPPTPTTTLSKPVGPSEQMPGFVLQAGAMVLEENAKALADSLRQRNFPAFMVKYGSNHLYRVYVGPYPDHRSAVEIDTELAHQGFTAILKSWSPPSKPEYRSSILSR